MAITNLMELVKGQFAGGVMGSFIGASLVFGTILAIGLYIYFALVWMTIAKKLKYKSPWLAWIPIANIAMILELGEFPWALVFLVLVPVLGWIAIGILAVIATWRIFEKRKYPGWLALISLAGVIPFLLWLANIAYLIILGFVAWKDK